VTKPSGRTLQRKQRVGKLRSSLHSQSPGRVLQDQASLSRPSYHSRSDGESRFKGQPARLILTSSTSRLSQTVSFDNLSILKKVNKNEVVVLLPEAICFILNLDRREEDRVWEKREVCVLDDTLGVPKVQLMQHFSKNAMDERGWSSYWAFDRMVGRWGYWTEPFICSILDGVLAGLGGRTRKIARVGTAGQTLLLV